MIPILICDDDTLWTQKLSREIERFQIASDWEVCLPTFLIHRKYFYNI